MLLVSLSPIFSVFHSTANYFEVRGHFETSAPNNLKLCYLYLCQSLKVQCVFLPPVFPWTLQGQRYPIYMYVLLYICVPEIQILVGPGCTVPVFQIQDMLKQVQQMTSKLQSDLEHYVKGTPCIWY